MPSSEKIISPGVFTTEIDQSYLPAAIGDIGGAIVGPTVKGPAGIPVVVGSFSEFEQRFGDDFSSGSDYYRYFTSLAAEQYLKHAPSLTVIRVLPGDFSHASSIVSSSTSTVSFKLHTLGDGTIMNSNSKNATNNVLPSGSIHNLRWEITNVNNKKGTFTLLVRRGNDSIKRKVTLETWSNVSLDTKANNYIGKAIGDQKFTLRDAGTTDPYLQLSGSFPNKSKYVRVEVISPTVDYLDENGDLRLNELSSSLPSSASGSFAGGTDGTLSHPQNFYHNITSTNTQGLDPTSAGNGKTSYEDALNLLSNQDEYDFNLLWLPGISDADHNVIASKAIQICEDRGDCFTILDPVLYNRTISQATTESETRDTSYAAHYWPWIQIPDNKLGGNIWVPPSVAIPGIYAFNDKVAHPWFAPAGLNRGGIDSAIMAERKLTHANRDTLYDSNVNPIATFPGQGVTVYGQKTLQKKASALDRINVRRLLIKLKKFIASSSRFLVFEQNNSATRRRFLNIVNPFLESVQSNSGLTAFRVVMDETNNTPDVVDRNVLYGQIFVQPTRTAEFIVLDFTVQPSGATFPE